MRVRYHATRSLLRSRGTYASEFKSVVLLWMPTQAHAQALSDTSQHLNRGGFSQLNDGLFTPRVFCITLHHKVALLSDASQRFVPTDSSETEWYPDTDSNRNQEFWRLVCYHYTIEINWWV